MTHIWITYEIKIIPPQLMQLILITCHFMFETFYVNFLHTKKGEGGVNVYNTHELKL